MSFGENLISLRKQMGWSQDDLANNLNLSRQAISKWENDTSKPDIDNVKKISKIFSVTIDDLLNNEVPKEKAVALDVKKQEKKERTITIVKLMIIAVIVLYVISVIYKFASLLIIVNGVQKYANLSNYHYVITTYDENGLAEKEECWFKDGVSKTVKEQDFEENITIIDYKNNKGYITSNSEESKMDINMDDYTMMHTNYSNGGQLIDMLPKIITRYSILDILLNSFNTSVKINLYDECLILQTRNSYITVENENLLPIMLYSTKDRNATSYYIEIDSVSDIEI